MKRDINSLEPDNHCENDSNLENIDFATIDYDRARRKGFVEIIYGLGKTPTQVSEIFYRIFKSSGVAVVTRATEEQFVEIRKKITFASYSQDARMVWADSRKIEKTHGKIAVISAGTADIPIAEEAALTAEIMGCNVVRFWDIGIAGIHRLFEKLKDIQKCNVVVAVAGMDGALPTVVAGLVNMPVIAVPTNTGYGVSFGGVAALLTMLNSCAPGVSVVNINAGHSAGYQAALILKTYNLHRTLQSPNDK